MTANQSIAAQIGPKADLAMPHRIQRQRTKGWRMPENTVSVTRPGEFGNPFSIDEAAEFHEMFGQPDNGETPRQTAIRWYCEWLNGDPVDLDKRPPSADRIALLRGKNLACTCRLCDRHRAEGKPFGEVCPDCAPCHSDPLGEIANAPHPSADRRAG